MADLVILDIGHGNCAVLHDAVGTVVVDAGHGATLLDYLQQCNVSDIDAILISHADSDHIAGLAAVLNQPGITVHEVFMNPDALRRTDLWRSVLVALQDAGVRGTRLNPTLATNDSGRFIRGNVQVEILAPEPVTAVSGAGGKDLEGRPLSANAMSAVIRIVSDGVPEVLLAGDLDEVGLENLVNSNRPSQARVLVFPHHGGRPGRTNAVQFAERIGRAVQPEVVIFSIGRGRYGTPLPEIIRGVRIAVPSAHIACTQLSERCAAVVPPGAANHLGHHPARGRRANACCIGTLELNLGSRVPTYAPSLIAHERFVTEQISAALCMGSQANSTIQADLT